MQCVRASLAANHTHQLGSFISIDLFNVNSILFFSLLCFLWHTCVWLLRFNFVIRVGMLYSLMADTLGVVATTIKAFHVQHTVSRCIHICYSFEMHSVCSWEFEYALFRGSTERTLCNPM